MTEGYGKTRYFTAGSVEYQKNFDKIFGKKKEPKVESKDPLVDFKNNLANARLMTNNDIPMTREYIEQILVPNLSYEQMLAVIAVVDYGMDELEEYIRSGE